MTSDTILLQQCAKQRDAEAFRELNARYAGLVYGTCLRVLGNPADAEDVAQECFLELARKAGAIHTSLPGWLHALARSRSIDLARREATRRRCEQQAAGQHIEPSSWAQLEPYIDDALAALPDDLRQPILLHYLLGYTQAEAAACLETTQATVSRRLEKGIEALRARLHKAGIIIPVALLTTLLVQHTATAAPAALAAALGKMAVSGVGGTLSLITVSAGAGKALGLKAFATWKIVAGIAAALAVAGLGVGSLPGILAQVGGRQGKAGSEMSARHRKILRALEKSDRALASGMITYEQIKPNDDHGAHPEIKGFIYRNTLTFDEDGRYHLKRSMSSDNNVYQSDYEWIYDGANYFLAPVKPIEGEKHIQFQKESFYRSYQLFSDLSPGPCFALGRGLTVLVRDIVVRRRPRSGGNCVSHFERLNCRSPFAGDSLLLPSLNIRCNGLICRTEA